MHTHIHSAAMSPPHTAIPQAFKQIVPRSPLEMTLYHWVNILCDVTDQMTGAMDLKAVIQRMLEVACNLLAADRCVVLIKDPARPITVTHEYRAAYGISSILGMTLTQSPLIETVFNANRPLVLMDFESAGVKSLDILSQGNIKSTILCRLSFRGSPFGVLSIQDCSGEREWTAEDVALTRLIGTTFGFYLYALRQSTALNNVTASFMEDLKLLIEANSWQQLALKQVVSEFQELAVPLDDECLLPHFPQLTKRERQILIRLDQKNKQIGRELMLSEPTIKGHVGRILGKLGKSTRAEAFALVRRVLQGGHVSR